jgi:hypothetical protein
MMKLNVTYKNSSNATGSQWQQMSIWHRASGRPGIVGGDF